MQQLEDVLNVAQSEADKLYLEVMLTQLQLSRS